MSINLVIWGIVFAVMVVVELSSMQLISIWFAAGTVAAFITALFDVNIWIQLTVFVIVSIILLIATRPLLKKFKVGKAQPTNTELDIGKTAVVIEEIDNNLDKGRAKLNGVDWKAISVNNTVIPSGSIVEIKAIKGSKLLVSLCKETINN